MSLNNKNIDKDQQIWQLLDTDAVFGEEQAHYANDNRFQELLLLHEDLKTIPLTNPTPEFNDRVMTQLDEILEVQTPPKNKKTAIVLPLLSRKWIGNIIAVLMLWGLALGSIGKHFGSSSIETSPLMPFMEQVTHMSSLLLNPMVMWAMASVSLLSFFLFADRWFVEKRWSR